MAKTNKVTVELNPEQFRAYNMFADEKDKDLNKKFTETFRTLYERAVPEDVRKFVDMTELPEKEVPVKPKRTLKQNAAEAPLTPKSQSM